MGYYLKIIFIISMTLTLNSSLLVSDALAVAMSSENYSMPSSILGQGAVINSTSTNYVVEFAVGAQSIYDAPAVATPSGGGGGGGGGAGTGSQIRAFNVPLIISVGQSGVLNYNMGAGNKVELSAPRGIVISGNITFTITKESLLGEVASTEDDTVKASLVEDIIFDISAIDQESNPVISFTDFMTITLTIPNLNEYGDNIGAYYFNNIEDRWILISDAIFGNNEVTFQINHLTKFAIFSVEDAPEELIETSGICDVTRDGKADIFDFNILMVNWGQIGFGNSSDCSRNGIVDIFDFNLLMVGWLK